MAVYIRQLLFRCSLQEPSERLFAPSVTFRLRTRLVDNQYRPRRSVVEDCCDKAAYVSMILTPLLVDRLLTTNVGLASTTEVGFNTRKS